MTQPATNAQVALQAAAQGYAAWLRSDRTYAQQPSVTGNADAYLKWLNANTPPPADQPGELA